MRIFPAGLIDQEIEIFGQNFKTSCLHGGQTLTFAEFPIKLRKALQKIYDHNSVAQKAMQDWGVQEDDQLERFTFCMYGGYDHIADFTEQEKFSNPEYHNHCGLRGNCKFEGKCCTGLNVANGRLTPREIEVAGLIGKCYSDKAICMEIEIAQDTLRNHKNSIERKAGVYGKVGIAVMAHKNNLV